MTDSMIDRIIVVLVNMYNVWFAIRVLPAAHLQCNIRSHPFYSNIVLAYVSMHVFVTYVPDFYRN